MSSVLNETLIRTELGKTLCNTILGKEWVGYQQTDLDLKAFCTLPHIHINSSRLRYCPLCLQEEPYWRMAWQLRLSVACVRHQIWLHDVCPHCEKEQSVLKVDDSQTKCLEQLPYAEGVLAPQPILEIQRFLETGLLNQDNSLVDTHHHQPSVVERCEFIAFMLKWLEIGENMPKPARLKFEYVNDFQDKAIQCADALCTSPQGFWRYLQTINLSNANHIDIQQKRLVWFYREFFKQFPTAPFKPLRDMVEAYATMNLIKDITQKHTLFSPNAKKVQLWFSFQKTCKEYGIASSVLSRAITDKQVKVHINLRGDYTQCAVYRPDLEKILPHLRGLVPASDAAEILGVTKAQFIQLQNSGCFKFEIPPRQEYCQTWQYSRKELETILFNINIGAVCINSDCLTISQFIQHYIRGTVEMPFLQVYKAIVSGQLIVRKVYPEILKIRDLFIDKHEFLCWLSDLRPDPGYITITEASEVLEVNEEFAYQLVNRGYLHHKIDSRNAKVIFPDHIWQFKQDYVILSKLSEASGKSSAKIIEHLESLDIFPVDQNDEEKLRQKLYTRADIMNTRMFYRYVQYLPGTGL